MLARYLFRHTLSAVSGSRCVGKCNTPEGLGIRSAHERRRVPELEDSSFGLAVVTTPSRPATIARGFYTGSIEDHSNGSGTIFHLVSWTNSIKSYERALAEVAALGHYFGRKPPLFWAVSALVHPGRLCL